MELAARKPMLVAIRILALSAWFTERRAVTDRKRTTKLRDVGSNAETGTAPGTGNTMVPEHLRYTRNGCNSLLASGVYEIKYKLADSRVLNLAFENQKNGSSSRVILQSNLHNGCTVQTSLQSIHLQCFSSKISSLKYPASKISSLNYPASKISSSKYPALT